MPMGYVNDIYLSKLNMVQQKLHVAANRAGIAAPTFRNTLQQAQSINDDDQRSASTEQAPSLQAIAAGYTAASVSPRAGLYDDIVQQAAATYALDANLIKAVIQAESSFRPDAVSSSGAQGLMQIKPGTAQGLGLTDSFSATQNIMGGAQYLKKQLDRFGDIRLALAAYNTGPAAIEQLAGTGQPNQYAYSKLTDEERRYVDKVFSYYNTFSGMTNKGGVQVV